MAWGLIVGQQDQRTVHRRHIAPQSLDLGFYRHDMASEFAALTFQTGDCEGVLFHPDHLGTGGIHFFWQLRQYIGTMTPTRRCDFGLR